MTDILDRPQPGYWLLRLARGAPEVPARIWGPIDHEPGDPTNPLDRSPLCLPLQAEIAGEDCDPYEVWTRRRRPISRQEYEYRLADCRHARDWRPDDPLARPRERVDWLQAELPW